MKRYHARKLKMKIYQGLKDYKEKDQEFNITEMIKSA